MQQLRTVADAGVRLQRLVTVPLQRPWHSPESLCTKMWRHDVHHLCVVLLYCCSGALLRSRAHGECVRVAVACGGNAFASQYGRLYQLECCRIVVGLSRGRLCMPLGLVWGGHCGWCRPLGLLALLYEGCLQCCMPAVLYVGSDGVVWRVLCCGPCAMCTWCWCWLREVAVVCALWPHEWSGGLGYVAARASAAGELACCGGPLRSLVRLSVSMVIADMLAGLSAQ